MSHMQESLSQLDRVALLELIAAECAIKAELLEALQAMVKTWDVYLSSPKGYPAYGKAVAAIAKATGEQA